MGSAKHGPRGLLQEMRLDKPIEARRAVRETIPHTNISNTLWSAPNLRKLNPSPGHDGKYKKILTRRCADLNSE
jgi:hypothetical protein